MITFTSATLAKMAAMTNPLPKSPTGENPMGVVQVTLSMLNSSSNEVYNPNNVQSVTVLAGR